MLRRIAALMCLAVFLLPSVVADDHQSNWSSSHEFVWEHHFDDTYITTGPLFVGDSVLVRTSSGGSPSVTAFDFAGQLLWSYSNPNSTNHDMSPLRFVPQGEGVCGNWNDLVLVGWTDGTIDALDPQTGFLQWTNTLNSSVYGVTGSIALDGEFAVVPSSLGVGKYCLADGEEQWWTATGFGWRNGVSSHEFGYTLGDEDGNLWKINRNGSKQLFSLDSGKIRHAPLMTEAGLLIHAQATSGSTILVLDPANFEVLQRFSAGPSPAIPLYDQGIVITGDSSSVAAYQCQNECILLDKVAFHSNGEIGNSGSGIYVAAMNEPDTDWGVFSIDENQTLHFESLDVGLKGYGTAAPGFALRDSRELVAFGDDQGIVRFYRSIGTIEVPVENEMLLPVLEIESSEITEEIDWKAQGYVFVLYIILGSIGVQFLRGSHEWLLRTSSLFFLVLFLMLLPELSGQWSEAVNERLPAESSSEVWNDDWPDEWLGTQVVVFEFEDGHQAIGGLLEHADVYSLTQAACQSLDIEYASEEFSYGTYIVSLDGVGEERWVFSIDGSPGVRSVDSTAIESTSIVRWSLA